MSGDADNILYLINSIRKFVRLAQLVEQWIRQSRDWEFEPPV